MTKKAKVKSLLKILRDFDILLENEKHLLVHKEIDQFFYMQRTAELKFLLEQLSEIEEKKIEISKRIELVYDKSYCQWVHDGKWLAAFRSAKEKTF